ncbi:MAG TPA: D-aminoacylase [Ktedonobacteraceae bacterium]
MYDLLIRNAKIVDGTGGPVLAGEIGVVGERIVAAGARLESEAETIFDAGGQAVAPGFIDAHTHDDLVVTRQRVAVPKIQQGITTLVVGNCGFGMAPMAPEHMHTMRSYAAAVLGEDEQSWNWPTLGAWLEELSTRPLGQHTRALLGHTALRVAAMGFEPRPATEQELLTQEKLVAEAMQAGAAGLSLGLMYVPGIYTPAAELVRMARVVGRYGGVVTSHMRGEGDLMLASLDEMLSLAEQAEVAVHISHLKVIGRRNWGNIERALERIADARARGLSVTVDMYPYTAGSTTITQLLPPWIQEGGLEQMLGNLRDPAVQRRVSQDFARGLPGWENQVEMLGWERIVLSSLQQESNRVLEGLNMLEAAAHLDLTPEEAFFRLLLKESGRITIVVFSMDERDVDRVVQSPFAMIGSDGLPLRSGRPHPRLYGTFPRYLQRYVRELKSLTLPEAIHKITAFPATRFGIAERGVIAPGKIADLVIFDPEGIRDCATYNKPQVSPEGIAAVIVAGQPVVLHGHIQSALPGRLLVRSDSAH